MTCILLICMCFVCSRELQCAQWSRNTTQRSTVWKQNSQTWFLSSKCESWFYEIDANERFNDSRANSLSATTTNHHHCFLPNSNAPCSSKREWQPRGSCIVHYIVYMCILSFSMLCYTHAHTYICIHDTRIHTFFVETLEYHHLVS